MGIYYPTSFDTKEKEQPMNIETIDIPQVPAEVSVPSAQPTLDAQMVEALSAYGQARFNADILQKDIVRLEARIQELNAQIQRHNQTEKK